MKNLLRRSGEAAKGKMNYLKACSLGSNRVGARPQSEAKNSSFSNIQFSTTYFSTAHRATGDRACKSKQLWQSHGLGFYQSASKGSLYLGETLNVG